MKGKSFDLHAVPKIFWAKIRNCCQSINGTIHTVTGEEETEYFYPLYFPNLFGSLDLII